MLKAIGKIGPSLPLRDFHRNSNLYGRNYFLFIKWTIVIGTHILAISNTSLRHW